MGHWCVVQGCKNSTGVKKNVRFHSFPLTRGALLTSWLRVINRTNWVPSKFSKICSDHFLITDYKNLRSLKTDAVPSQLLPFSSLEPQPSTSTAAEESFISTFTENNDEFNPELMDEEIDDVYISADEDHICNMDGITDKKSTGTQTSPQKLSSVSTSETEELKKKIKTLQRAQQRDKKKITALSNVLNTLKDSQMAPPNLFESFSELMSNLLKEEQTLCDQESFTRRFPENMKSLPCERILRNWLSTHNCDPEFMSEVFSFLKSVCLLINEEQKALLDTQQHTGSADAEDEDTATITNCQKFEQFYIKEEMLEQNLEEENISDNDNYPDI